MKQVQKNKMKDRISNLRKALNDYKDQVDLDFTVLESSVNELESDLNELGQSQELEKPEFKEGDWVVITQENHPDCGDVVRIIKHSWASGLKWRSIYPSGENGDGYTDSHIRKATPEEIKTALVKEAERRYDVPCRVKYLDGRESGLSGYWLNYDPDTDTLYATSGGGDVNYRDSLYHKGKWAEILTEPTFFDWEVEVNQRTVVFAPVCRDGYTFDKNTLRTVASALHHVRDKTVQQVIDELDKLELQ